MNKLSAPLASLKYLFEQQSALELAVLVGSRANGSATPQSDWDIAIRWHKHISPLDTLALSAALQQQLAQALATSPDNIDLIKIPQARLTMRALIAEEGILLKGDNTLAWSHFLVQTWGELEDYYWRAAHAV